MRGYLTVSGNCRSWELKGCEHYTTRNKMNSVEFDPQEGDWVTYWRCGDSTIESFRYPAVGGEFRLDNGVQMDPDPRWAEVSASGKFIVETPVGNTTGSYRIYRRLQ